MFYLLFPAKGCDFLFFLARNACAAAGAFVAYSVAFFLPCVKREVPIAQKLPDFYRPPLAQTQGMWYNNRQSQLFEPEVGLRPICFYPHWAPS
jgi:hypothetical protein